MNTPFDHSLLTRIVDDLVERGWSQQNDFLPQTLVSELAAECRGRSASGALMPAGTGRGAGQEVRETIRGDRIQWLEPGQSTPADHYLAIMDNLRQVLNQGLYLGLEDYESHFAFYPAGAFYKRHLDRFHDDDRRTVSAVLYLNQGWVAERGGQLRLHLEGEVTHDVQPEGGCLVVFMSGDIPHEVLPATHERMSLTGWFRRRGQDVI